MIKHIHFVGIKGVGMTALALYCQKRGIKITGSDLPKDFVTDAVLKKNKIQVFSGFKKEHIVSPDLIITTGAHQGIFNPEVLWAKEKGLKILTHAQALGEFMKGHFGISVCGVGGKSTTASMLAVILQSAGLDPSYVIGVSEIINFGPGGNYGSGKYFIAEADEYASDPNSDLTPRFLYQDPSIIILTNLFFDHPDVYKNFSQTQKSFLEFIKKIPSNGFLVANIDNINIKNILKKVSCPVKTYGQDKTALFRIIVKSNFSWEIENKENKYGPFTLRVFGLMNIYNATAAIITALSLGVSVDDIKKALYSFRSTSRRQEFIGKKDSLIIYDDYAHHPQEIFQSLKAFREYFKDKKITVIFQPHTYSRTKALLEEFSRSFENADRVILTDIFASEREKKDPSVNSRILAEKLTAVKKQALYFKNNDDIIKLMQKERFTDQVIITMGAGDVYKIGQKIFFNLK